LQAFWRIHPLAPAADYIRVEETSLELAGRAILFPEGQAWIAYLSSLDLGSYGDDPLDAFWALGEALRIVLSELHHAGGLPAELARLGWHSLS
jgi:hypothetical protein